MAVRLPPSDRLLLDWVSMRSRLLEEHRDKILELAARHGASNVRVFGSLARGEGATDSDLDLLVTLEEKRSLLDLVGLKQDIEDLLHRPVEVVTEPALSPYIQEPSPRRSAAAVSGDEFPNSGRLFCCLPVLYGRRVKLPFRDSR
jgi:uncharacterized protein